MCLVFIQMTNAQTNYYNEKKTFYGEGYTYQCYYNPGGLIKLYNSLYYYYTGKWVTQKFKDTGEVFYLLHYEKEDQTYDDEATIRIMDSKVKKCLAPYQHILHDEELLMEFVISTTTGKIIEVYFKFTKFNPYTQIPLSVYRNIELAVIGTQFKLTEFGKRLNYLYMWHPVAP